MSKTWVILVLMWLDFLSVPHENPCFGAKTAITSIPSAEQHHALQVGQGGHHRPKPSMRKAFANYLEWGTLVILTRHGLLLGPRLSAMSLLGLHERARPRRLHLVAPLPRRATHGGALSANPGATALGFAGWGAGQAGDSALGQGVGHQRSFGRASMWSLSRCSASEISCQVPPVYKHA